MDDLSEDCVLGSNFLHQVNPYLVNHRKCTFTCFMKNKKVVLPLSFRSIPKCRISELPPVSIPNRAQLMKMDRCKVFSEIHGEKALKEITEKLKKDCCSDSPNAFWTHEFFWSHCPMILNRRSDP